MRWMWSVVTTLSKLAVALVVYVLIVLAIFGIAAFIITGIIGGING